MSKGVSVQPKALVLQCTAVWFNMLQFVAVQRRVVQHGRVCCSVLQCVAVWCSTAVQRRVLQCVAVCCSVL